MLVLFAITTTALLAMLGLLYSFGLILSERRTLQAAADAASLRGAWQVLAELQSDDRSDANVLGAVVGYAQLNGVPSDGTSADATYVTATYVDGSGTALGVSVGSGGTFPVAARGVRVSVQSQVGTVLPGFVKIAQVLVQGSASASAVPAASPTSDPPTLPLGVNLSDFNTAYTAHATYDLLNPTTPPASGVQPTLALIAAGATDYGSTATNLQFWCDGQHTNGTLQSGSTLSVIGNGYTDSVLSGLRDNVRRQNLQDASPAAYAVVSLPVWDTVPSAGSVHVVGFAHLKIRSADITSSTARGTFVPYASAAWGVPPASAPSPDVGAVLVSLRS